jgi:AraC-like DNA-binding protein
MTNDSRIDALRTASGQEIFHSVTHQHQVWLPDPFDVDCIHAEARDVYLTLLQRVTAQPAPDSGRILLLKGDSGAGKTHLMRAFRYMTHQQALGYFSYMQMTSAVPNYSRYVLRHTIDSLEKPYNLAISNKTGLTLLSNTLAEMNAAVPPQVLELLRHRELEPARLNELISRLTDRLMIVKALQHLDPDMLRALLFLQTAQPALHHRVARFLRCEPFPKRDQDLLGGLLPREQEDDPPRVLQALAQVIQALQGGALVICLDQLEDILQMDGAQQRFNNAMRTVIALAETPNIIVIIACLEDFYTQLRQYLSVTHFDRIEHDPPPMKLIAERSAGDITALVARRLEDFFATRDVAWNPDEPLFPFTSDMPKKLAGLRTRSVLDWCREQCDTGFENQQDLVAPAMIQATLAPASVTTDLYREQSSVDGSSGTSAEPSESFYSPAELNRLDQDWNDCLADAYQVPEDDPQLLELLAAAVEWCIQELHQGYHCEAMLQGGGLLVIVHHTATRWQQRLWIALCQQSILGRALETQIDLLMRQAGDDCIPIAVRSVDFPSNPKTRIAQRLGELVTKGGRRIVVNDSEWRTIVAMTQFISREGDSPALRAWQRQNNPLSRLPALRELLDLDSLAERLTTAEPVPDSAPPPVTPVRPASVAEDPVATTPTRLSLGYSRDVLPQPITLPSEELCHHFLFLGGQDSERTALALNVVEQAVMRGIPAILIDHSGRFCGYADPNAWRIPLTDAARIWARDELQARSVVTIYTPGLATSQGQPLHLPLLPAGLQALPSGERHRIAGQAAQALGSLMNYKAQGIDLQRLIILSRAIEVFAELQPHQAITLDRLTDFISTRDLRLAQALGRLDTRHFKKVLQDLQTQQMINDTLFQERTTPDDITVFFEPSARGAQSQQTPLSIIHTSFLGDQRNVVFWLTQFLLSLNHYVLTHPAQQPQLLILFDTAERYLPMHHQVPTHDPLETLLKKAHTAGLGLLLNVNDYADLDDRACHHIASWFIGKMRHDAALQKLGQRLEASTTKLLSQLSSLEADTFYLLRDQALTDIRATAALIPTHPRSPQDILQLIARQRASS